ncbi:MAG TPA: outer membrane protein transport protein [Polyangiaceae bacterium]|nr:outer membrane protein transport protein [Polyangiaceae bacterium]
MMPRRRNIDASRIRARAHGLLGALAILGAASQAAAAGTALDVQSARCTGMAAACTSAVDDATAIFYNPAGITQGKPLDAEIGVSLIDPEIRFKDNAGNVTQMPFRVIPPVTAYVTGHITRDLTIGVGEFTPYGLAIGWPAGWEGRSEATSATLRSFDFNPTIAYRFGPVRLGAGFQLVRSTIELQKDIAFGSQYGSVDLGAGAWGVGANGGVQVDVFRKLLTLGATYRSAVHFNFDGHAHFDNVPATFAPIFYDQPATTQLTNPDQIGLGVSSRPIDTLLLDFDVVWTGWSKFRSINIDFPDDTSHSLSNSEPKNWHDTVNYHLGAEGIIGRSWRIRGGVLYDPTPSPDDTLAADLPDATRLTLAVGGGYVHECGIRVDVAYQILILFNHVSTWPTLPGQYGGEVNVLGISIGYALPERRPVGPPPATEPAAGPGSVPLSAPPAASPPAPVPSAPTAPPTSPPVQTPPAPPSEGATPPVPAGSTPPGGVEPGGPTGSKPVP